MTTPATVTVTNPQTVSLGDPGIAAEKVTSFNILVGTASGGPYTASTGVLQNSSLTDSAAGATGPWSDIVFTPPLQNFVTYYAVAQAVNAQGASADGPAEISFLLATTPSAPVSFSVA